MDLFALNATQAFGSRVAAELGVALATHEEREFENSEYKVRLLVSVRGRDVYVIQSRSSMSSLGKRRISTSQSSTFRSSMRTLTWR